MNKITRQEFLKLGAMALGSLAFTPFNPRRHAFDDASLLRVATTSVSIYKQPTDESEIVMTCNRDNLLNLYGEVMAAEPVANPVWYRVWGGYVHRAHMQRVRVLYNRPAYSVPETGVLGEVTVPYTETLWPRGEYQKLYRLYYGSVHWVTGVVDGPDGEPWYTLLDELNEEKYIVPAIHMRLIPADELSPISPEVPFVDKRVEVSLNQQKLWAYEYDQVVMETTVSTGLLYGNPGPNGLSTKTPAGEWHIEVKMPSKHMGNGNLAYDIEAYDLPGVPWNCFFTDKGHAFHGTYWHDNYGTPMSHGCVNMRTSEARWLWRWTRPTVETVQIDTKGYGTLVIIRA